MDSAGGVVVFAEQQCSWSQAHTLVGRAPLGAVHSLADTERCTLVARVRAGQDGEVALLGRARQVGVAWAGAASLPRLVLQTWRAVGAHTAVVVYLPGIVGVLAGMCAVIRRRKLVAVCVGNASESLSPDVVPGAVGTVARWVLHRGSAWLMRRAVVARYVTSRALQRTYPPGATSEVISASDVGALDLTTEPRDRPTGTIRILTVASMDQPYKGVPELVDAVIELRSQGHDVVLRIAGTGRLLESIQQTAERDPEGIEFLGHLGATDLADAYAASDVFALASWTEGMPRALVEAMAAGLPAIATDVGGNSELLGESWLCRPRDPSDLRRGLSLLLDPKTAWRSVSAENIARARALVIAAQRGDREFVDAVSANLGVHR